MKEFSNAIAAAPDTLLFADVKNDIVEAVFYPYDTGASMWPELTEHFTKYDTYLPIYLAEPILGFETLCYLVAKERSVPTIVAPTTNLPLILTILRAMKPDTFVGQSHLIEVVLESYRNHFSEPLSIRSCFTFCNQSPVERLVEQFSLPCTVAKNPLSSQ